METAEVQMAWSIESIRREFPILSTLVRGKPLVYLDNAATTQKPRAVLERIDRFYRSQNSNIHRAVHYLSAEATHAYEEGRSCVAKFLNADRSEIIFTRGVTEGMNLLAHSLAAIVLKAGDEVIISEMDHHSNIVPWQMACQRAQATLKVIPVTDSGELQLDQFEKLLTDRTRIVSIVHVSNTLGTVNPVERIISLAHAAQALVILDGAQAVSHQPVDVRALDCDFYLFSSHKLYGPTGIGVLYGKYALLNRMPPFQGGGDMIRSVRFSGTEYQKPPTRFEAGTPNIEGVVGLAAAIDFVQSLGMGWIAEMESALLRHATDKLSKIPNLKIIGEAKVKAPIISLTLGSVHPHDIGTVLDQDGIAIRTGHHCTQPLMDRFQIPATARASFAFYNTTSEVDQLAEALSRVQEMFGHVGT